MNAGLTSVEIRTILDFKVKANDEQVKIIRGIFEGEWKERQLRQKISVKEVQR